MKNKHILFIGDVHGQWTPIQRYASILKDTVIFCVGDLGLGFKLEAKEQRFFSGLNDTLEKNGNMFYSIRGNHDNPSYWFKNKFKEYKNIQLVQDHKIVSIGGWNIFCIGGAISIDRKARREGVSYWKDEIINQSFDLIPFKGDIDIVVTHSAPTNFFPYGVNSHYVDEWAIDDRTLKAELMGEREYLKDVEMLLTMNHSVKYWFYGHFHSSNIEIEDNFYKTKKILLGIEEVYSLDKKEK